MIMALRFWGSRNSLASPSSDAVGCLKFEVKAGAFCLLSSASYLALFSATLAVNIKNAIIMIGVTILSILSISSDVMYLSSADNYTSCSITVNMRNLENF